VADDDRPQYQHGIGTIGGSQFHWGSGEPGKYWSIPYGDYPVTPNAPTGAWAQQAGAIPVANNVIPDPLLGRNRIGIMIHSGSAPDLDTLYTQGCFKVAPQEWPAVRSEILKEAANGPLYLHVAPGGVAAFTNTKTFSQAGEDTPAANANAAGNTTAAPSAPPYSFSLPANAPMGMGNNNPLNIKYAPGVSYAGLVGPSSNTDQGDPQNVFQTPEAGWAAGYSLLNKKYGSGMTTPNQIIAGKGGWTPGNTQAAANVAKAAGIGPDDDIGFNDPLKAQKFMRALATQEQGSAASAYPDAMIASAVGGQAPGPIDPSIIARGGTSPPIPGTTLNAPPPAVAATPGVLPGFPGKAQSDAFTQGATALDKAIHGDQSGGQQEGAGQAAAFNFPQARNVHPLLGLSSQIYGNTLNSLATPLQWSSASPGQNPYANAGGAPIGQQFGTQLSSMEQLQQMMAMMGSPYASPTGT
jgi:hypothetical protein